MTIPRKFLVPASSAGAVALITAGLLVGAAQLRGSGHEYVSPQGAPTDDSRAVQAMANEVFESFNGTVQQRNASGVVQAWALNGAMDTCMEEHGHPEWDWSATRNTAPRTNALGTSRFFSTPLSHAYSNALMDTVDAIDAENGARTTKLGDAENKAVDECLASTPSTPDDEADVASTPTIVRELRSEWWSMLESLDYKYGDHDAYGQCFAQQARSLSPDLDVVGDTWQIELTHLAPPGARIPETATSALAAAPSWTQFRQVEGEFEALDWLCRQQTYAAHLDDVESAVDSFAKQHAADVVEARAQWQAVQSRAAELGYHGQTGPIE